jgi:hypothetical protein
VRVPRVNHISAVDISGLWESGGAVKNLRTRGATLWKMLSAEK